MSSARVTKFMRLRSGLPQKPDRSRHWAQRALTSPWLYIILVATIVYVLCLYAMYMQISPDREVSGGTVPGINLAAIKQAAGFAWPTLLVWSLLFLWLDRFRPQRLIIWGLVLGWGASVSTWASMILNTWAAEHMSISGDGDPATGARAAIYAAPFIEEAMKASVLFLIVLFLRYRWVNKLSAVALGGLSAIGFAFTENILYYGRAIVYSSTTIQAGDAEAAVQQLVFLRGVMTSFGHPLFTSMTAIGLVVGVRARSRIVRVLAPLTGFCIAALLHMLFNGASSVTQDLNQLLLIYLFIALPIVLAVVVYMLTQLLAEGRLIRARLGDYVRMGWLTERDPEVYSRLRRRLSLIIKSLTRGFKCIVATIKMHRRMTEIAYLRDAMIRGIVDDAGRAREHEILTEITSLRAVALADPKGLKWFVFSWPFDWPRRKRAGHPAPSFPPPTAVGPVPATVGQVTYAPVDPDWGPPSGR